MPNYGDPKYWENRYKRCEGTTYDWLQDYASLKSALIQYLKPDSKILVLGCGNACFSEDMYDDGFQNIYNNDISQAVIIQMQERNKSRIHMKYEVMDVCDMTYEDNYFDVVIDKSTMDALLCIPNAFLNIAKMKKEAIRVLKPNGVYLSITFGRPENRDFHYIRPHLSWDVSQYVLNPSKFSNEDERDENTHYLYVCRKHMDADQVCKQNFSQVCEQLSSLQSCSIGSHEFENSSTSSSSFSSNESGEEPDDYLTQKINEQLKQRMARRLPRRR